MESKGAQGMRRAGGVRVADPVGLDEPLPTRCGRSPIRRDASMAQAVDAALCRGFVGRICRVERREFDWVLVFDEC
jgi:hypothetical protein